MASLPLFRLPLLALEEFVRCLTPVELFVLSICSRRAARIVPLSKSSKFDMKLNTAGAIRINHDYCFISMDVPCISDTYFNCKTLGCTARHQKYGLTTYWEDTQLGLFKLSLYLSELFHCPTLCTSSSPSFVSNLLKYFFPDGIFCGLTSPSLLDIPLRHSTCISIQRASSPTHTHKHTLRLIALGSSQPSLSSNPPILIVSYSGPFRTVMASLPLFRLPLFALEEFVRCLTPVELFVLSICSRRAARIVPLSNSSKFDMKLDTAGAIRINDDYCFISMDVPCISDTFFECKTLGCTARHQKYGLTTYWGDRQLGLFKLNFYLSELFHCPIRSITYSPAVILHIIIMASLPLFRLPLFALQEFVRCLTPVELFILSICSRRAARIVPLSISSKFDMKLDTAGAIRINHDYCFISMDVPCISDTFFECKTLGCTARHQKYGLNTYWGDTQLGLFELSFYLSELFHCPIRSITYSRFFHRRVSEQETREYIREVNRIQNGIDCVQTWENGQVLPFKW
ncbi:unnamed protein product [Caenorhabditis brenneri]